MRLIRSKGVGVYFVTQNPIDIPDTVLGQLGNKVQHALRAFTPRDQKSVKAMAETFRPNPEVDVEAAVTDLAVGEALLSLLEADGSPAMVSAPSWCRRTGTSAPSRQSSARHIMTASLVAGHYEQLIDRESAEEVLLARAQAAAAAADQAQAASEAAAAAAAHAWPAERPARAPAAPRAPRSDSHRESTVEAMSKSVARAVGSQMGRQLVRGLFGTLLKR